MMTRNAVIAAVAVAALCAVAWLLLEDGEGADVRPAALQGADEYAGEPLSKEYRNGRFGFSLRMPESFTARELPPDEGGGEAVVLESVNGEGIQVYVVPAGDEKVLAAEDIRSALPDLLVREPETIEIGQEYRGVAFLSDNEAFGGASREVWFYFRGSLYQISSYERLDTLLKAMFATWRFD